MSWNSERARISAVISVLALLLSACTSTGSGSPDDEPVEIDAYTEKISQCLTTVDPAATGEPLTGEPGDAVTTDPEAGLAYRTFGDPWQPFDLQWSTPELQLAFDGGQMLLAETGDDGTQNWAVISSTRMPNVVGDALVTDLGCLGALAVADIIAMTGYRDGAAGTDVVEQGDREIDGRAAWLNITRYKVIDDRFESKSELQGTLLVDTDRGVGVVYVTVPDARGDLDGVLHEVFESVRVL
ncbi:hypothetical protein [Phytomonospora endophytica]|uniref:Lipoprotein n=1 Tax=Phytomonospora endophytica TaxID=714109 RepID=A0A841FME6_9ACTN|nr:hypothetical protein [Phytomonospora endophytica]MBB6033120.1 hypothetical protein [Phytomonospora endophytica]GIG65346.1 hypothetical protein Pen01_16410 [Phytomonospora endophytica]